MELIKRISVVILVLSFSVLTFGMVNPSSPEETSVKNVIEKFVTASENNDASALDGILFKEFSFVKYNTFTKSQTPLTKGEYLDMVKKGTIGAWKSNLNISSVDVHDNTAVAKVELTDTRVKESGFLTLIKVDGNWQILSGVYSLEAANK